MKALKAMFQKDGTIVSQLRLGLTENHVVGVVLNPKRAAADEPFWLDAEWDSEGRSVDGIPGHDLKLDK